MAPVHVQIAFDNVSASFSPGEAISGKVIMKLEKDKNIYQIDLNRIGEAKVFDISQNNLGQKGKKRKSRKKDDKTDSVYLLNDTIHLKPDSTSAGLKLPAKTYEYPFSWSLPDNLSASFDGPYGRISYRMEVVLKYSSWDFRLEAQQSFFVTGKFDLLNLERRFFEAAIEIKSIRVPSFRGDDVIGLTFVLEKKAFVPGELIKFTAAPDYQTDGGTYVIPGVNVSLVQEQTYRIRDYRKGYTHRLHKQIGPNVLPNICNTWNGEIPVPQVPPTSLGGGCWFIDVQYYVKVSFLLTAADKIEFDIRVLIGTEPVDESRRGTPYIDASNVNEEPEGPLLSVLECAVPLNRPFSVSPSLLNVPSNTTRRASAPSVSEAIEELETPPPTYNEAMFFGSDGFVGRLPGHPSPEGYFRIDNGNPPEYQAPPAFFMNKRYSHVLDSFDGYNTQ